MSAWIKYRGCGGRAGGPYNDFSTHKSQPKKQIGIKFEKLIFSNRDF